LDCRCHARCSRFGQKPCHHNTHARVACIRRVAKPSFRCVRATARLVMWPCTSLADASSSLIIQSEAQAAPDPAHNVLECPSTQIPKTAATSHHMGHAGHDTNMACRTMWQLLRTVGCVSHSQSSTGAHFGEHVADNATVVVLRNEQKLRPAQDVVQIVLRNG
jgi:hypothetical protein